jgi:GT2 family glycosyltransferase
MQAQKPTASIIIPNKDEWKMTCRCLEAIRKFTRESCEVILVDNGSSKVPEVIRQYPFLRLIRNNWNRGFAAAINQGLERAKGEYLVWLNNDTLPSYRWLTQLLHVLRSDSSIGLVGPVSNRVIPEQKIAVSLRSVDKILRFSRQFNRTDPDRWFLPGLSAGSPAKSGFAR